MSTPVRPVHLSNTLVKHSAGLGEYLFYNSVYSYFFENGEQAGSVDHYLMGEKEI